MKRRTLLQAAAPALLGLPALSRAQAAYPSKSIRYIVPVSAGGGSDMVGRTVTERWGQLLKQSFVVDNQGGGGGVIACQATARAAPDGYTLLIAPDSTIVIAPLVTPETVKYDALKDLAPVGLINITPLMLVTRPGLPVNNFAELVRYARANPGKLNYASPGVGNLLHVAMESLRQQARFEAVHVPYKAAPQIVNDLIGNQVDLALLVPSTALPHIRAGKIKAIGVTVEERLAASPDVPSLTETPETKDFRFTSSIGLFAPGKTPATIVERLNRELNEVLALPDVRKTFEDQAASVGKGSAADFTDFLRKEAVRNERVVKAANIKAE